MQSVSQNFLSRLTSPKKRLRTVVEIYHQDAVPGENGFDPAAETCLLRLAASADVQFRGENYARLVNSYGDVTRTLKKQLSSFSFTLSNVTREIAAFELSTGFEGLICVLRLVDAEISTALDDSIVLFTGRCEKPDVFERSSESVKISVKQILNQTEVNIPRRKFTVDDPEGRAPNDPLFEGFIYTPRQGRVTYTEVVKKRFLIFFTKKKTVTRTLQYSSHSDMQSESVVPLPLGRVQVEGINFAYQDVGTQLQGITFFGEGEIADYINLRSVTPGFPLTSTTKKYGKKGGTADTADTQSNDAPGWIGAGTYSRLAYARWTASGTRADTDDPAPQIVAILLGVKVPVPAGPSGGKDFSTKDWSDNPVTLSRWVINSEDFFNLAADWLDDEDIMDAIDYCDHILMDTANTDRVFLPVSQSGLAGTDYSIYRSTAEVSPEYWLRRAGLDTTYDAFLQEAEYNFYSSIPMGGDDPDGDGLPDYLEPPARYRRRYTANVYLTEQMKAIDFLFDILFASSNLYLVQKASGKIAIRVARPVDFAFLDTANSAGADEILVKNINPFKAVPGRVLVGANTSRSEVRRVTGARYKTDISISLSASGGVSWSARELGGGSDDSPPSAELTCTNRSGTKTVIIGDFTLTYAPRASDTLESVSAMLAAMINAHNELNKFVKAVWVEGDDFCTVSSRIGYLKLDAALENAHNAALANPASPPSVSAVAGSPGLLTGKYYISYSFVTEEGETLVSPVVEFNLTTTGKDLQVDALGSLPSRVTAVNWYCSVERNGIRRRLIKTNDGSGFIISELPRLDEKIEPSYNDTAAEIHRIALAFSDKPEPRANLTNSNVLAGSFKFPLGSRQPSTNRIVIKYREAAADFKLTELRVSDRAHQRKVKKINDLEINGAAIDNYHQARRIANQKIAELRDGDRFFGLSSDGEALLLEEGDVVAVTDSSGDFVNEPCRVEDVNYSDAGGYPQISFTARKYRRRYYDDQIQERLVPLPIVTNSDVNTEMNAPTLYIISALNAAITIGVQNYSVAAVYRKIEVSTDADFSVPANIEITLENTVNTPGFILRDRFTITRSTNLSINETRYVRVSHSSNGVTYGATSAVKTVVFADDNGNGGSTPEVPTGPGTTTGTGTTPPDLPPGGPCFTGDTLIRLADGREVRFDHLYENKDEFVGCEALGFDENNVIRRGRILAVWRTPAEQLLEVEFSNGKKLRMVKTHRFWTEHKRFTSMYLLTEGERVWHHDGVAWELVAIKRMRMIHGPENVFNMTVECWHDYFADGFAVSNSKPLEEIPV